MYNNYSSFLFGKTATKGGWEGHEGNDWSTLEVQGLSNNKKHTPWWCVVQG